MVTKQFQAGTVAHRDVITAQTTLLANEITLIQLQGRRMAQRCLIPTLGGGWNVPDLPSADAVSKRDSGPAARK